MPSPRVDCQRGVGAPFAARGRATTTGSWSSLVVARTSSASPSRSRSASKGCVVGLFPNNPLVELVGLALIFNSLSLQVQSNSLVLEPPGDQPVTEHCNLGE